MTYVHFIVLWNPRTTQKSMEGHRKLTTNLHLMSLCSCELPTNDDFT